MTKPYRKWLGLVGAACYLLGGPVNAETEYSQVEKDARRGYAAFARNYLMEALTYLERAASQGHVRSQFYLAYLLDEADENAAAEEWFQRAVEGGDAEAMYYLGRLYLSGEQGVERDEARSLEMVRRSADGGYRVAMRTLGGYWEFGQLGLDQDPAVAWEWYQKAAELGDQEAIGRLIQVYTKGGLGQAVSEEKKVYWEARLAEAVQADIEEAENKRQRAAEIVAEWQAELQQDAKAARKSEAP